MTSSSNTDQFQVRQSTNHTVCQADKWKKKTIIYETEQALSLKVKLNESQSSFTA